MKISVELTLDIRENNLAEAVARLTGAGCDISSIAAVSRELTLTRYRIDLVYGDPSAFKRSMASFEEEPDKYTVVQTKNYLEELLAGGFLEVHGAMRVDTPEDYEMNVLGVKHITGERIAENDNPMSYTGVNRNIGCITGIKSRNEKGKYLGAEYYVESEIAAVMLSKFGGYNGFPFLIRFDQPEDFLKNISAMEAGFSAFRINHIDDDDNAEMYEQLQDMLNIPFISHSHDELSVFALAGIMRMIKNHRCRIRECNIGFIGLNAASIRLSKICQKIGCMRVLGFDNNEKNMLTFERNKGLATTPEHIFGNSDIVLVMRNHFSAADLSRMRPGIIVISFLEDSDMTRIFEEKRSCREIIPGGWTDPALLYPGIIRGMIASGKRYLTDDDAIALGEMLSGIESTPGRMMPNIFSDIHERIEETMKSKR